MGDSATTAFSPTRRSTIRDGSGPPGRSGSEGNAEDLILHRYRLGRRLGAGGFGMVWLARDERLERDVAVKMLPRERIAGGRFEREARATARLNHPGIVTLYEAAVDDDGAYLVSELVRGRTLARLLGHGLLSDRDVARVGIALCDALEYAHRQGVVHRDVKPSNVLVPESPATGAEVAKLTDFGVARLIGGDSLTRTGDVIGTTCYMAPEQAEGREVHPAADLYSLALVIYEALTTVNPLRQSAHALRGRRLGTYLPAVRRHRRDLPRELACGIDLALRPRARERGTIIELRRALSSSLHLLEDRAGIVTAPPARVDPAFRVPADPEAGRVGWDDHDRVARAEHDPLPRDGHTVQISVPASGRVGLGWSARGLAAAAAAVAAAWFAATVLTPPPVVPAMAVLGTALLVAMLPRTGWLALSLVGAALLVSGGNPGGAIVLGLAVLGTAVLLVRRPTCWPLPAVVPLLSLVGLAGAWPALAGHSRTAWRRMMLGATGWIWLLTGEFLTGRDGLVRLAPGTPAPRLWMPSLYDTVHKVLHPLLSPASLAPALVWGAGALVLPLLCGSSRSSATARPLLTRIALLAGWALAVLALTYAVLSALRAPIRLPLDLTALGLAVGAVGTLLYSPHCAGPRAAPSDSGAGLA